MLCCSALCACAYPLTNGSSASEIWHIWLRIRCTSISSCFSTGALVGPPWEKRQNGYLLRETVGSGVSLFYEPHCDYSGDSVQRVVPGPVDVLVAPVLNQDLIAYPLVRSRQAMNIVFRGLPVHVFTMCCTYHVRTAVSDCICRQGATPAQSHCDH